ncbi:hypothetical protein SARC_14585, partial [Sphaeroforma arctica JP610]
PDSGRVLERSLSQGHPPSTPPLHVRAWERHRIRCESIAFAVPSVVYTYHRYIARSHPRAPAQRRR